MAVIRWLQRLCDAVPPVEAALWVVLATVLVAFLFSIRRSPQRLSRNRFTVGYLLLAPTTLLMARADLSIAWAVTAIAAGVLLVLASIGWSPDDVGRDTDGKPAVRAVHVAYLVAATVIAGGLIFVDLGGYLGRVAIWEYDTLTGLVAELADGRSITEDIVRRLGWHVGLVSTGQDSLLFGGGVRWIWTVLPISTTTLRLPAAVLAMACLPAIWLAGRRCADAVTATAATVALAISPMLIFYGRYGSSLSATLFATLLALAACCLVVCPSKGRWWTGLVAGGALYLVTLGYSVARPVAVALLGATVVLALLRAARGDRQRVVAAVLMVAIAASVWIVQHRIGRDNLFVDARGEQLFVMLSERDWIRDILDRDLSPEQLTWSDRCTMAGRLLQTTLPQLGTVLARPLDVKPAAHGMLEWDPPKLPLVEPWLLVFTMLGLTWTVRFIGRPFHLLLVVVTVAAVVPALLTTRVDTHRLVLLEIPIFLWAGMGLAHAIRIATACRVPPALLHGSALALMLLTAAEDSALLYHRAPPHHPVAAAVVDALNADDGPVLLVPVMDFRDLGSIVLDLADQRRSDPTCSHQVLERGLAHQLSDLGGVTDEAYEVMRSAAVRHAVYLVPDSRFEDAAARAKDNGLRVDRRREGSLAYWRISAPEGSLEPVTDPTPP